ncbi:MAG: hypothetical protein DI600_09690, partial [Cutibacterium granulosum]
MPHGYGVRVQLTMHRAHGLAIGDEAMTRVRIVRATIALSLALAILVLEWVWRHRTYEDLEQRDGKCVVVGETVNNGRVPVVPCQEEG